VVVHMPAANSSSPMCPARALMPPWAATVWLRVGEEFCIQAVDKPAFRRPKVARQAGTAGPDHEHIVRVVYEFVRSCAPQRHLQNRKHTGYGQQGVHESQYHQRQGLSSRCHVHNPRQPHALRAGMVGGDQHETIKEQGVQLCASTQ